MKRLFLMLICLSLWVAPIVAQSQQWIYGILLWKIEADTYVWNVSTLYEDFDRDGFQELWDIVDKADGGLVDYLTIYGVKGFELVGIVDKHGSLALIFKKPR